MQFKKTQLVKILGCSQAVEDKWIDPINAACEKFGINTKLRLAAFIAQVGHESGHLTAVLENLNYSAEGLQKTWPSRFNSTNAATYARKPELIANKVYGGRMGNGDEESGDGWKYRGRGLIQCTGKSNYDAFSQACGVDAVSNPDSLAEPINAALSAAWFWGSKGLNTYADRGDFLGITKRINGGTIGLADREKLYKIALIVLSDEEPPKTDEELDKTPVPPNPFVTAPINEQKSPAAQNSSIVEPRAASGYGTGQYPWNQVYESRSGHVTEVDDTPGAERLSMTHRTGSYWEVGSDGSFTHKSVLDSYRLTREDAYDYTGANYTCQVKGQYFAQINGTVTFKVGGDFHINAPRIQFNTGSLNVSNEINAKRVNAPLFSGMGGMAFGEMVAKEAIVAYYVKKGKAPLFGGSLGFTGIPGVEGSADGAMSNNLAKKRPNGTPWITNGIDPATVTAAAAGAAAAAIVTGLLQSSDADENVANAMNTVAEELDEAEALSDAAQTPVFLKHVSFDKPTLLSQSTTLDIPDPSRYVNNLHVIVDSDGVGTLHMSNGEEWIAIGDPSKANEYTDTLVGQIGDALNNEVLERLQALANEAQTRADAIAQEAWDRQRAIEEGLLAEAMARGAAVTAEAEARQTEDESIASRIVTLTAAIDTNAAAIQEEQRVRADAISAEAYRLETLAATVDGNTASIQSEAVARANADGAISTRMDSMITTMDDKIATITTEMTTLVDSDEAMAQRIDGLVVQVADASAAIITEQTARITSEEATATQLNALVVKTDETNAAVLTEQEARATADSAMATQINGLIAKTDAANAMFASEQQARADSEGAIVSNITILYASTAAAQSSANDALSQINTISDDNVLTKGEKSNVIQQYTNLTNEQTTLEAQAVAFGLTTEKTSYTNAVNALKTYITGLSPAYNDTTQNTTIDGPTFRTKFSDVYTARASLMNAIDSTAKSLADSAQGAANAANTAIADISNDNILSKGEKSSIILQYTTLTAEQTALEAQGTAFSITTEKTAYTTAINALKTYITGLSPAYNDTTQNTTIVGTTFRTKFSDVYAARVALLNAIDTKAKSVADAAMTAIGQITNDNVLSKGEKSNVILQYLNLTGEQITLETQANSFSITVEKSAYTAAINALKTYITGLTPAYDDVSQDTTIDGPTLRTKFADVYTARANLMNAIDLKAKILADSAISSAQTANNAIADIANDNILTKGEKSDVILQYDTILNEQVTLENQGTAFSITTEKTAYTTAVNALKTYITGLIPAYNDTSQNTTIVGGTFRQKFRDVYSAKQNLLNAIDTKAKSIADGAVSAIAQITSDNVLSKGEKSNIILQYNAIINDQTGIDAQATAFSITTQKTTYDSAITALTTYLNGLTPAWNDVAQDTPITGTTMRTKFTDVYSARTALLNAIDTKAKSLADAAQTDANTANTAIGNITSDNVLSKGEKSRVIREYTALTTEQAGIDAQATSFEITTEKTAYDNAVSALTTYLTGLTPAWNTVTVDTPIVGSTFRSKFTDVYNRRQTLLNAIYAKAKAIADSKAKVTRGTSAPADPSTGDVWIDTTGGKSIAKTWNGTAWAEMDSRIAVNEAAIQTEENARTTADTAIADSVTTLTARVQSGDLAQFEPHLSWEFNNTADSWTVANGGTATVGASFYTMTTNGVNQPYMLSPTISVDGSIYDKVRARVRRKSGTGWNGTCYYSTSGHGTTGSYFKRVTPAPTDDPTKWFIVEWDMTTLNAGGDDWVTSTIIRIRLDLGLIPDSWEIDWVAIGKRGVGISGDKWTTLDAQVQSISSAYADGDVALASQIDTVRASVENSRTGVFAEHWMDPNCLDQWQVYNGTGERAIQTGAAGKILRVGNNADNDMCWMVHKGLIPYDSTRLYRMTVKAMQDLGTGTMYAGFVGVANDGVTLVNVNGADAVTSQHFHVAVNVNVPNVWTTYTGYTKDVGATTGNGSSSANPLVPRVMHPSVKYLRPMILVNYNAAAGRTYIGDVVVDYAQGDATDANLAEVTVSASASATAIGDIKTLYSVKLNANGYVSGFTLINNALPGGSGASSAFIVQADQFKLVTAGSTDVSSAPFTVNTTTNKAVFQGSLSVKSATTGARTEITDSVIKVYDSGGTLRVKLGDLDA